MVKKTPTAFSDAENSETLNKVLKVVNSPSGKKYTNGLNLKGEWMKKFGFDLHDIVNVTVTNSRILIEKIIND